MINDKQISCIKYHVTLKFSKEEKEILEKALAILKVVNKEIDDGYDDENITALVVEPDAERIILELDKFTDYICKK